MNADAQSPPVCNPRRRPFGRGKNVTLPRDQFHPPAKARAIHRNNWSDLVHALRDSADLDHHAIPPELDADRPGLIGIEPGDPQRGAYVAPGAFGVCHCSRAVDQRDTVWIQPGPLRVAKRLTCKNGRLGDECRARHHRPAVLSAAHRQSGWLHAFPLHPALGSGPRGRSRCPVPRLREEEEKEARSVLFARRSTTPRRIPPSFP